MTYKRIELFYVSTVQFFFYLAILLLGCSLVLGGLPGLAAALPVVGTGIGLPLLVLVLVPIVATLLITGCAALFQGASAFEREPLTERWLRCAGCTLAVVSCIGGVAQIYAWVLRPLLHWS
jgi:hypothetical protein